jgi:hypothetical protein
VCFNTVRYNESRSYELSRSAENDELSAVDVHAFRPLNPTPKNFVDVIIRVDGTIGTDEKRTGPESCSWQDTLRSGPGKAGEADVMRRRPSKGRGHLERGALNFRPHFYFSRT